MLTITLSELMSDVQGTQMKSDGSLEESGEARRLRKSLEEMANGDKTRELLKECGLSFDALQAVPDGSVEDRWSWLEVKQLADSLLLALDAGLEHALLVSVHCQCFSFFLLYLRYCSYYLKKFLRIFAVYIGHILRDRGNSSKDCNL